jgi:hypothetical protein
MSSKIKNLNNLNKNVSKLGGIGAANIGTDKWNEKRARYQKMKEYGKNSQIINELTIK